MNNLNYEFIVNEMIEQYQNAYYERPSDEIIDTMYAMVNYFDQNYTLTKKE